MPFLFADFGWESVVTAAAAALVTVGGAAVGWYLLLRDKKQKLAEAERNMTARDRAALRKERIEDERSAMGEVWDLYEHVKNELERITVAERVCNRRLARMEAALKQMGVKLDDFVMESGKHWDDDSGDTVPTADELKKAGRLKPKEGKP